jgi:hypothetical protein
VSAGVDRAADEAGSLADIEAAVAELCGTINVATAALVDILAQVCDTEAWAGHGYRSLEHSIAVHCGVSTARAAGLARLARRSRELPATLAKFRTGALSEDQVRPIARHVPARHEAAVADFAEHATPNQVARVTRSYSFAGDADAGRDHPAPEPRPRPSVSFGFREDGSWWQTATLAAHDGALVQQALEAARDEVFAERTGAGPQEVQITWADALVRLADHALAHMGGATAGAGRSRHQVLLHQRVEDLDGRQAAESWLHLGPAVSRTVARYLSCDSQVRLVLERDGRPVSVGRRYRTVPERTRLVVEDRDRGCRYPGCINTRWVDCHHIRHWQDGGPTDTANLCCLCRLHHRQLHLGHFRMTGDADRPGGLVFTDRFGRTIPTAPRSTPPTEPPPTGAWDHPTGEAMDTACVWFADTG